MYWPKLAVKCSVHILGLDKMARTCPIITYETDEAAKPKTDYFLRACAVITELKLVLTGKGLYNCVCILLFNQPYVLCPVFTRNSSFL